MFRYYFNIIADITFRQLFQRTSGRILRLSGGREFNVVDRPCIFVLSTGRTGTKTLARLASLSSRILAFHEPSPKLYGLSSIYYRYSGGTVNDEIFTEAFLTARRERFRYALMFDKGYIETSPQVTFLAPATRIALPQAKFIHVVRDPKDFVRSGMRRGWYDNHPMDNTRLKPTSQSGDYKYWQQWDALEKICWLWKETNIWIKRFTQTLPIEQKLFLRSENIFHNKKEEINNFFDFLNTPIPPDKRVKKILSKKINAQKARDFQEVSDWSDELHAKFYRIAGESAKMFGYIY
jgi:hypothetical protein